MQGLNPPPANPTLELDLSYLPYSSRGGGNTHALQPHRYALVTTAHLPWGCL